MDFDNIILKIQKDTTACRESIHGDCHWDNVARFGKMIAEQENLNERVVVLFGYFHDCQRLNDGRDPEHGPRAANYIECFPKNLLGLTDAETEQLKTACRYHTCGHKTNDPVVHACWDADRLDLTRIGVTPDPKRLFTRTAKRLAVCLRPSWDPDEEELP